VVGAIAGCMLGKLDKPKKRMLPLEISATQPCQQTQLVRLLAGRIPPPMRFWRRAFWPTMRAEGSSSRSKSRGRRQWSAGLPCRIQGRSPPVEGAFRSQV